MSRGNADAKSIVLGPVWGALAANFWKSVPDLRNEEK